MRTIWLGMMVAGLLMADFRYEQTTRVTKGMMMKMPFGKKPEPTSTTHYMKGARMATVSKDSSTVIDFDKQTITSMDMDKKKYWQMTFDEMRQMMEQAQGEMQKATKSKDASLEMKFDAKATGVEKEVGGYPAKQMLFTIEPQVSDGKQSGAAMKIVADSWHSEAVPGYKEYQAFYSRLKDKAGWLSAASNPMAQMGGQKGMAEGMRKMSEEMQKTPGIAVLTITRISMPGMNMNMSSTQTGADGQPQQVDVADAAKDAAARSGGEAAGRKIAGPLGGMVGGALGGKFGGFGKKKKEDTPAATEKAASPAPVEPASGDGALFMESFTDASGFSAASISEDVFAVPANFTRTESPLEKMRKK